MIIISLKPIDGESLGSFVFRVLKHNKSEMYSTIINDWGTNTKKINSHNFPDNFYYRFSALSLIEVDLLLKMNGQCFFDSWGEDWFTDLRKSYRTKFCPLCIQKVIHHKQVWMYKPVTICIEHKMLLVDECEKCHNPIMLKDLIHGCCGKCGALYKMFRAEKIMQGSLVMSAQTVIQSMLHGGRFQSCNREFDFIEYMTLAKFSVYLLEGLESFELSYPGTIKSFQNKKMGYQNNASINIVMTNLFWMYQNFPINFNEVLKKHIEKPLKMRNLQTNKFEIIFTMERFKGISLPYNEFFLKHKSDDIKTVKQDRVIKKYERNTKQNKSYSKQNCQVKQNIIVQNTPPETLDEYMTRMEASHVLRIGIREQVNNIINAGFFPLYRFPGNKWLLKKNDVFEFRDKIIGMYTKERFAGKRFYEVLKLFKQNGCNLVRVLEFIRDGKLTPYHNKKFDACLSDSFFKEEQIQNCSLVIIKEKQLKRGYTLQEFAKMIKVDRKIIKKLMEHHVIQPTKVVSYRDGRQNYFFDCKEVDDFVSNLVTLAEATRTYNIPSRQITSWIKEGLISDKFMGFGRKYYVDKRQLEKLLMN